MIITQNLEILKANLLEIDLSDKAKCMSFTDYAPFLTELPGKEPHRLLAFLSTFFPNETIFDIGTHYGNSALAMSYEPLVNVVTYDIFNFNRIVNAPKNIEFCIGDFRNDSRVLSSPLILIDVDPHDAIQEKQFHEFFLDTKYKGIVLWDDIHLYESMQAWWDSIDTKQVIKIDLTAVGHATGTGMIIY
jgi:hypothetical protein